MKSSSIGHFVTSGRLPTIFLSVTTYCFLPFTFFLFRVMVTSASATFSALLAGSRHTTGLPSTFRIVSLQRVWSCPKSTMSKPGTSFATRREASSSYSGVTIPPSLPLWKTPMTTSGFSFSWMIFIHLRAQVTIFSNFIPLQRFSVNQLGIAGVSIPRTAIFTPSRFRMI